jgi:hypothetical protein
MRQKTQLFLLLIILVLVEGNVNRQDASKPRGDERRRSEEVSNAEDEQEEFVYSDGINSILPKAVRIVPVPDLSKSEDKWKSDGVETGDVDPELLSEPAKWIQRMIAEVEGAENELLGEGDEEKIDREYETEDSATTQPPRELTPLEKEGQEKYLASCIENCSV